MATWAELERGDPDLAAFERERFEGRVAFHATPMADGGDHEGTSGEFVVPGWMEQVSEQRPGVAQRPYSASYTLASFACSTDEAVATTYPGGGSPVYRRRRP